jgi:hypothetical protein
MLLWTQERLQDIEEWLFKRTVLSQNHFTSKFEEAAEMT